MTRLTPAARAALIARAKRAAPPVVSCVAARLRPDHIIAGMTRDELAALVIVLAETADPTRLRAVTEAADDGTPDLTDDDLRLRRAHSEYERLRAAGLPIPNSIRCLDSAYHQRRREAKPLAVVPPARPTLAAAVPPDPDAEQHRQALADAVRRAS